MRMNQLYYGDNLQVFREHIADESVDLIYHLTYQQRFIQSDSTNKLTGLTMPTVIVPLDIH